MGQLHCNSLCADSGNVNLLDNQEYHSNEIEPEVQTRLGQIRDLVSEGNYDGAPQAEKTVNRLIVASVQAGTQANPDAAAASREGANDDALPKRQLSLLDPSRITNFSTNIKDFDKAGIATVFLAAPSGNRCCSLTSRTDRDGGTRSSFEEKSEELLCRSKEIAEQGDALNFLTEIGFGWVCKKGLKPGSPNQDSFSLLVVEKDFALIGVYDGHGPDGHDVSQCAREEMVKLFMQHPDRRSNTAGVFKEIFVQVQNRLAEITGCDTRTSNKGSNRKTGASYDAWESGTTCTMVYIDIVDCTLTVAHVGDARSCLGKRKASEEFISEDMTKDHKPNDPVERRRIESANPPGRVIFDGYVNHRVFVKDGHYPGLNMSRALGDVCAHKLAGLTAVPDTRTVDLKPYLQDHQDVTLLVATDGLWEFIEGADAFGHVKDQPKIECHGFANKLALESWAKWMADSEDTVCDDITVVCLQMHQLVPC